MLRSGYTLAVTAHQGPIPIDFAEWPVSRAWVTGRAVVDGAPVHVADLTTDEDFPDGRAMALRLGHRTIRGPLLQDDRAIGAIALRRREVRPFSERQIALLKRSPTRP